MHKNKMNLMEVEKNLTTNQNIRKLIREIRLEQNKKVNEMAEKLSISAPAYSMKERGQRKMSIEDFFNICVVLNLDILLIERKDNEISERGD